MLIKTILLCLVTGAVLTEAPDDETCVRVNSYSLECNVRTLSSDQNPVGAILSDGAERLAIYCHNQTSESTLRDHHFEKLQGLSEISIDGCKILRLPGNVFEGLRGLKSLKIHSLNNEWSHSKEMDLSLGAFNGMRELHTLDLGWNNIRKIPSDLFCALENVITLNLTRNKIKFVDELGFGHKCGTTLQSIDLSFNVIASLPVDSEILHLRRLTQLFLQNNKISELPGDVFSVLLSLKIVNVSNNYLKTLPYTLFHNTKEMREIYLRNNELENLPKGVFNKLEQLLVLDLSSNKLKTDHIENETFGGLIRLIVLDLSNNLISHISKKMFKDLFFLQILNLSNNSIDRIDDNAFSPLFNLHTLNLGNNRLLVIEQHMFNGLYILNKLSINNNVLSFIDENAFKNCSDLKELDLSSNRLTHVPEAIIDLQFLKSLDLGENIIREIRNGSFRHLSQLTGLRLIDNQIGNLTAGMFMGLSSLQVLNLAKNKIMAIHTDTFQAAPQLEAIRLDNNFISNINGVFVALAKLLWLNLSENHLVWFDYAFLPPNLDWLDIHANFIENLGNYYKMQRELKVKTLDASHNRLVAISDMAIPNSVELLFINNNFISNVDTDTFIEKQNITRVDMYANELESLDINSLRIPNMSETRGLPEFYISGNPFRCDCSMKWLPLINQMTTRDYPRVMDLENVVCKESYVRGAKFVPVTQLQANDFLCKYNNYCANDCDCCDFNKCHCRVICPKGCSCYHDASKTTNVVDCSGQNKNRMPEIPFDATHLYLDGNKYINLNQTVFNTITRSVVMYLNSSVIASIHNNTFSKLTELKILHLENNQLERLSGPEFSKLTNLKELFLQGNNLDFISNETFYSLSSLEVLRLDSNNLVTFGLWHLDNNKKLKSLYISENRWSCDCKYLQGCLTYISQNVDKIIDIKDLVCINGYTTPPIKALDWNATVCTDINSNSVISALLVSQNLPLLASVLTGLMLILLIFALAFSFRYACRMWLYTNCGIKLSPFGGFEEGDKLYDAYVCYSPKDEEFVIETISKELENGYPSYHLCLHHRDVPQFEATYAQFPDLVVEATEASRRIIVILSKNFIRSEWSQLEFRQALQRALRQNPNKLIVVNAGPVPRDPDLKSYLKAGFEVTWKEKRFWERLRYAMPSPKRRRGQKLKRLNYGRTSNTYTVDASVLNSTCQTLCGKSANSAERSPCDRPLSEHIYSTIESDYSSTERTDNNRHDQPHSVVLQHTVQTYLV